VSALADAFLADHPELLDVDLTSEAALRRNELLVAPLAAYFRFSMTGTENVPREPCLLVANHSIASPFVLPLLARGWSQHFPGRPGRGLMHRVAWQWPWRQIGILQRLGGIYAHPDVAEKALADGKTLLVFPGGELDAMRPFRDRYRIHFGGRSGFVRLARKADVKISPLVICGSQAAYISLPGSEPVAKLVGLHRWTGLKRFPLTLGVAATLSTVLVPPLWPLAFPTFMLATVPFPTRIETRFLPPIDVGSDESDDAAAERVRRVMEEELGRMGKDRRWFLG
jgi:1-acyl-sn-glycerol-3-phosphate acyltransferase